MRAQRAFAFASAPMARPPVHWARFAACSQSWSEAKICASFPSFESSSCTSVAKRMPWVHSNPGQLILHPLRSPLQGLAKAPGGKSIALPWLSRIAPAAHLRARTHISEELHAIGAPPYAHTASSTPAPCAACQDRTSCRSVPASTGLLRGMRFHPHPPGLQPQGFRSLSHGSTWIQHAFLTPQWKGIRRYWTAYRAVALNWCSMTLERDGMD
mmetsp:Transcript_12808/g.30468  ORF Transcript_12808/g.30468 Transcript_12808/m.30468 type:complete len:213 (-) Transcript_12808:992-1630(-)